MTTTTQSASRIGVQVSYTIQKMDDGDPVGALHELCSAIEATATAEFGKGGKKTYKQFIGENFGLISGASLGVQILNFNVRCSHPQVKKNPDGGVPIQELFYHIVRCGLYHTGDIGPGLRFHDAQVMAYDGDTLLLPQTMIFGLLTAVVASPANSAERVPGDSVINFGGVFPIPVNSIWGRRDEVLWLLQAMRDLRAIAQRQQSRTAMKGAEQ